jgi:predicted lipoprotein with Yx(FWY)xxD motif
MRPLHAVVVGAIGLTFAAAGCGGAIPSSNGGRAMLRTSSAAHFLVDAQGHTLYVFAKDQSGESYCTGACAAVWPPLETSSAPTGAAGVDTAALGTVTRSDGDRQVTYHGRPLYYFAGDASTPGRTKGEALSQFGAEWYVVGANGKPLESKPRHSPAGGNGGSNSGGGAWG